MEDVTFGECSFLPRCCSADSLDFTQLSIPHFLWAEQRSLVRCGPILSGEKKKTQQILSGFCYLRDDKSPVFQLLYCFWINIVSYSYMLSRKSQSVSLSRSIKWWGTCQGSTLWKTVSTVNSRPPRGNTNTPVTLTQQRTVKTAALLHLRLLRILWKVTVLILGFFRVTLLLVFDVIRSSHIFLLERDKLRCHM